MKSFRQNLIVSTFFMLIFSTTQLIQSQNGYVADESLSMKAFQEQVLKTKGEIWVVDFWASWCRPCIDAIPEMKEIYSKYQGKPVRIISVSWDKDSKAWRAMLQKAQMPWQQILIPDIRNVPFLDKHFSHKAIPAVFVITQDGKIKKATDLIKLDKMLAKLLGG